jgi:murein DD-endopeptidase MepM/ murein hydrolase activator NlpD
MASAAIGAILVLTLALPAAGQLQLPPLPIPLPSLPALPGILAPPSPSPAPSTAPPQTQTTAPAPLAPAPDTAEEDGYPRCTGGVPVPPKIKRVPPGNTSALVKKAQPLVDIGISLDRVMAVLAPPFPVAGLARYSDDWKMPRWTPCPHLHAGTDIFAAKGTPIVASGPGTVSAFGNHPVGGLSVWISGDDRYSYFYTHLSGFAPGLTQGQAVKRSTVIGYVGATGNAAGGAPHLHFQVHAPIRNKRGEIATPGGVSARPGGLGSSRTPPVDPAPLLNQWLAQADRQAEGLVAEVIKRGGILPTDDETAEIIRSQSAALSEPVSVFGLGRNANRGILAIAVVFGGGALFHAIGVLGRSGRQRPKKYKGPDPKSSSLYAVKAAAPVKPDYTDPTAMLGRRKRKRE